MKNWLAQAVSKLALTGKKFTGFCKIMAVTHAKACIIAGCVVTVGTTGTVATAVYVNHANNNRQIVVAETVPTETEPATLKAVVTETTTEHTGGSNRRANRRAYRRGSCTSGYERRTDYRYD
ncbi:MAG: hypothetical protein ACLU8S_03040 [Coprococcus phoceensis]